jgi:DNA-binding MarR family transcriptional regulator/GNAT superfamily N-acetyltransferase
VRRFNRTTTERNGALSDGFLGRKRPYGQARLLWEIGHEGAEVRELRTRLGLDAGYVSRLLRALERDGLVTLDADAHDGRVRRAALSPKGRQEWTELEARSDALAASVLHPLGARQRARLVEAMSTVERLLTASMIELRDEDPSSRAARTCLEQYFAELNERDERGFDPGRSAPADGANLSPPAGRFLVARLRGEPVGCGGLRFYGHEADVKRMWVAPSVRGLGLGRRLLQELETRAREHGVTATRLETNGNLHEAISLYRASGYREVEPFNDEPFAQHWFRKELSG